MWGSWFLVNFTKKELFHGYISRSFSNIYRHFFLWTSIFSCSHTFAKRCFVSRRKMMRKRKTKEHTCLKSFSRDYPLEVCSDIKTFLSAGFFKQSSWNLFAQEFIQVTHGHMPHPKIVRKIFLNFTTWMVNIFFIGTFKIEAWCTKPQI